MIEAEADFYRKHNANAHRGIYDLGEEATEAFEGARTKIASFLGVDEPTRLVFTRGTTESINMVAHGWGRKFLREGDEILMGSPAGEDVAVRHRAHRDVGDDRLPVRAGNRDRKRIRPR